METWDKDGEEEMEGGGGHGRKRTLPPLIPLLRPSYFSRLPEGRGGVYP